MDWYFYQRTFEDCRRLFVEAGYDMDEMEVTRSDMAVIVNFIGRTKRGAMVRFDDAQSIAPAHLLQLEESQPDNTEVESGS